MILRINDTWYCLDTMIPLNKGHMQCPYEVPLIQSFHCVLYTFHAKVPCSLHCSAPSLRVEFTDNGVGWVADEGTEHSGNVASCEGDNQLSLFAHLVSRDWDHVLVEELHCSFESCKLHHGVRDLAQPQWRQALVEPEMTAESETGETRERETYPPRPSSL